MLYKLLLSAANSNVLIITFWNFFPKYFSYLIGLVGGCSACGYGGRIKDELSEKQIMN